MMYESAFTTDVFWQRPSLTTNIEVSSVLYNLYINLGSLAAEIYYLLIPRNEIDIPQVVAIGLLTFYVYSITVFSI